MLKTLILNLVLLLGTVGTVEGQKYGGGTGEPNDPYLIYDANHMQAIGAHPNDWGKHFKLVADIDLAGYTGTEFNIIGYGCKWYHGEAFSGVFNGNGHFIYNFTYESNDVGCVGLFGSVGGPDSEIRDLVLVSPKIVAPGGVLVGSLAGFSAEGTIRGCRVFDGEIEGQDAVGGLVGYNKSFIVECSFSGTVFGAQSVGGLVGGKPRRGYCHPYGGGTIHTCYSTGVVIGDTRVGGLVGDNTCMKCIQPEIHNCYSSCTVSGTDYVGGLCGSNSGTIFNCYSAGPVFGDDHTGGLVGRGTAVTVACYWDVQTSGQPGSADGTGKTTAELQTRDTFLAWGGCGSEGVWTIDDERDYPRLRWENKRGKPIDTSLSDLLKGSGTCQDPYRICTANQLNKIGLFPCEWDKYFRLTADIDLADLADQSSYLIGNSLTDFTGVFDGDNHSISNLTYTGPYVPYLGLFRRVSGAYAVIKNVGLVDPNIVGHNRRGTGALVGELIEGTIAGCWVEGGSIDGREAVGGLAGRLVNAHVTGCFVEKTTVSGEDLVGGLAGLSSGECVPCPPGTLVENCHTNCTVEGGSRVGGLIGSNSSRIRNSSAAGRVSGHGSIGGLAGYNEHSAAIWYCYANCDVNATGGTVGGLVGSNYSRSEIFDSYSGGTVSGDSHCGGLAGRNGSTSKIYRCYSAATVSGNSYLGGLVGPSSFGSGVAENSFWDIEASGLSTSAGGTGLTTREMQDANTFLNAGWDFVGEYENGPNDEWGEAPMGGYPALWWQLDPLPPLPEFSGGSGTKSDPYLIGSANDLNKIGHNPRLMKAHFRMTNDIDATDVNLMPIANTREPFVGTFDGNDKIISNVIVDSNRGDFKGLFEYVDSPDAEIYNLGMRHADVNARTSVSSLIRFLRQGTVAGCFAEQCSVNGYSYVGGLVGRSHGLIKNCYFTGDVSAAGEDSKYAGGLVGYSRGKIYGSYSAGSVSGVWSVGGLVGENGGQGAVFNCYFDGNVEGTFWVGGLAGSTYHESTTSGCYSQGSVLGQWAVGGLIGDGDGSTSQSYSHASAQGLNAVGGLVGSGGGIFQCYSTGRVIGTGDDVGGLVGRCYGQEFVTSFWDTQTSGLIDGDGGTGLATAEMQTMSTYTDASWDFNTPVWIIDEGNDYPRLWWEFLGPPIECEMRFTPNVLNLDSQGRWVKAHLVLPLGYTVSNVDADAPLLIRPLGIESQHLNVFVNEDGQVEIKVAFDRAAFCSHGPFDGSITVEGSLTTGQPFYGTATIKVIDKSLEQIASLASYWLRADCGAPAWCSGLDVNRDSAVNFADFALFDGCCMEIIAQ